MFLNSGAGATLSSGTVNWKSLTIASNATLSPLSGQGPIVVTLAISSNLTVQPGGTIAFNGCGFAANSGTGHGAGGFASSQRRRWRTWRHMAAWVSKLLRHMAGINYDSIVFPAQMGSGGGAARRSTSGSAGGGATAIDGHWRVECWRRHHRQWRSRQHSRRRRRGRRQSLVDRGKPLGRRKNFGGRR